METIIIGAGQAGLSASYYLKQQGIPHTVFERNARVGDQWRRRWDSLELFTPTKYNSLPGKPFPGSKWDPPDKDTVAEYMEDYAKDFELPVECGITVEKAQPNDDQFRIHTDQGIRTAENVIVATGAFQKPYVPSCRRDFDDSVLQLHSSEYRNPRQLKPGTVLVVGTGNSGVQIAEELSATHEVTLSGRDNGGFPRSFLGKDIYWWLNFLGIYNATVNSRIVKRMKKKIDGKGDPLVGRKLKEVVERCDIARCEKIETVKNGTVQLADGSTLPQPDNVIWSTGYRPDFSWIKGLKTEPDGYPVHQRGVVPDQPGLYFLGLKLLYRVSSSLLGGVGRDAQYIAGHIAKSRTIG